MGHDTFEEELPINREDQEYEPDDGFDPRECDRAAEIWERQFLDNFYYKAQLFQAFILGSKNMNTILISALTALIVSLLVHWFTVTQVTKWFDKFFFEQNQIMEKYADDIKEIINKRKL